VIERRPPGGSARGAPSSSTAPSPVEVGMRIVAAAAVLIGGLVHLELYFRGGYRSFPNANLGRSFLLNGVASVIVAAVLVVRRDVIVRLAGIAVAAGTLIAFYLTRETDKGIFGFTEKGFEPSPQAALALVVEIVAVVVLVASFLPRLDWKRQPLINTAVAGELALVVVAAGIVGSAVWAHTTTSASSAPTTSQPASAAAPSSSAAPAGAAPATTPAPGAATAAQAISIKDFSFEPPSVSIKVGGSVTWTNADDTAHSIESDSHTFDSPDSIDTGKSFTHTFASAGTFTYICGIHPQMKGTIVVTG
jgi:plastocyanin